MWEVELEMVTQDVKLSSVEKVRLCVVKTVAEFLIHHFFRL